MISCNIKVQQGHMHSTKTLLTVAHLSYRFPKASDRSDIHASCSNDSSQAAIGLMQSV